MISEKQNFDDDDFEEIYNDEQLFVGEDFDEGISEIKSSSAVHDGYQFEAKFDFELNNQHEQKKRYDIDVFFFIPQNMGINSENYSRENFYSDLTHYMRIRTPELFKLSTDNARKWTLPWSDKYFQYHLSTRKRQKLKSITIYEVKMFSNFINTQLKKLEPIFIKFIKNIHEDLTNDPKTSKILESRFKNIREIVNRFRTKYISKIKSLSVLTEEEVKKAFLISDEYISYRLEYALVRAIHLLEGKKLQNSRFADFVRIFLEKEIDYRKNTNFINVDEHNQEINEYYYYRIGLVKKYILEVLYLQNEQIKKEKTYRNMIAAAGAALAALWASLADIQRLNMMQNSGDAGLRLMTVVFVGVIAYVFKDRIKELSKEYFNQKLKHLIPDFDIRMFYTFFDKDGQANKEYIGSSIEFMRFLNPEIIPPDVSFVREFGMRPDLEPERKDVIIHYSKKVSFEKTVAPDSITKINFVRDIIRFDISEFLNKLDDPKKIVRFYDRQKGVVIIEAPKVYHINVIFKYVVKIEDNDSIREEVEYERFRIVLNKKGIIRVDKVISRDELSYSEEK